MNKFGGFSSLIALALAAFVVTSSPLQAEEVTSGTAVSMVEYGENGAKTGEFRQIAAGKWAEFDASGKMAASYDEVSRDDSAVVIEDRKRGMSLTFDMVGKTITFGKIGEEQEPLYQILSASDTPASQAEAGDSAPKAAPAAATADEEMVSGLEVSKVTYGSNGQIGGWFKKVSGKEQWGEYNASGKLGFKFAERSRSRSEVVLEDKSRNMAITLDLAAKEINFGAIGEPQELLYQILSAESPAGRKLPVGTTIAGYIDSLQYDPRVILVDSPDGSTESQLLKPGSKRVDNGGRVILTTVEKHSFEDKELEKMVVFSQSSAIYPGALVRADSNLVDGNPTSFGGLRAPVTISVNLPGTEDTLGAVEIQKPNDAAARIAINRIMDDWFNTAGAKGYVNPAAENTSIRQVSNILEASAELNFNAKSAKGEAEGMLKGSVDQDSTTFVGLYKQVFYTVSMDVPGSPKDVFLSDQPVEDVARFFNDDAPPAYIKSVDYGRIAIVRIEVKNSEVTGEVTGKGSYRATEDDEIGGDVKANLKQIAKSASVSAVILGGKNKVKPFKGDTAIDDMFAYIEEGTNYEPGNPGVPIGYTVNFLKDNALAKVTLAGNYTTRKSTVYPSNFIRLRHNASYNSRWVVSWYVPKDDGSGDLVAVDPYQSGSITGWGNWEYQINLPGDAKQVRIVNDFDNGFKWVNKFDSTYDAADRSCFSTKGTVFDAEVVKSNSNEPCL